MTMKPMSDTILLWSFLLVVLPWASLAFVSPTLPSSGRVTSLSLASSKASTVSSSLVKELRQEPRNATVLADYISALDGLGAPVQDTDPDRFSALQGLYEVSHVQTVKEGENPVGGTWTRPTGVLRKLWPTQRRSFQHILPVNRPNVTKADGKILPTIAQAVNVISLEALWGKWRATVVLRGDVVALNETERTSNTYRPLSNRAVRALFDPPRIVFGKTGRWFNVNVGPQTSVLLDTPYIDDNIRLGLGGQSGSRFVFAKCADDDAEDGNWYRRPHRITSIPDSKISQG